MSNACKSCPSASASGGCSSGHDPKSCGTKPEDEKIAQTLARIKHKIVVLSGKGGVGKSTVSSNIAIALAQAGKKVGLLDVDIHGPSIPRLLSLQDAKPHIEPDHMEPVPYNSNLGVMSLGFLIPDKETAVIWRGPMKLGLIKQFVRDVDWGDLDYLVTDCPPGTGDEPLAVLQTFGPEALAVIVTTPQGVAIDDVRRSVTFCNQLGNPVLGIVENMSGFVCPNCKTTHDIFNSGGGEALAKEMNVPFLGRIPMDPEVVRSGDEGYPFMKVQGDTPTGQALAKIVAPILALSK